jgi:dTDP-glucose pyrophosphorylase
MKASIENLFLHPDATIVEALECIEAGARQIALVVDDARHLLGTVTDGDVRRGILRGIGLDRSVSEVMNPCPLTAHIGQGRDAALRLMRDREIHQIPLLDSAGRVVGLETLDELIHCDQLDVCVVLMAGGWGTRLRPLTDHTPKPLLPVGGRPLLETIVENFANQGFRKIFLSVNYRAEMFEQHFGDGSRFGVSIEYIRETDRRGTAGALTLLPTRPESPLIVMNADILTTLDFRQFLEFHRSHRAKATMGVREYSFQVPYGVVKTDQARFLSITEKPLQRFFVSAGMYVLEPEVLNVIPSDACYDMPMLFDALLAQGGEASVFPVREYWLDIGRLDDLERAQSEFGKVFG